MSKRASPTVYVIARPNGAGKTTFVFDLFSNFTECSATRLAEKKRERNQ